MATVICNVPCKHRSKRPLRKWVSKDGNKVYGCKLEIISILRISDPDDYIIEVIGEKDMAQCINYEPITDI